MRYLVQLVAVLALAAGALWLHRGLALEPVHPEILATGLILVAGYLGGRLAQAIKLPRITGYILIGLGIGPAVLGLLSEAMVESLQPINGIAVSLIALTAGMEINVARLRQSWNQILVLTACNIVGVFVVVFGMLYLLSPWIGFLSGEPTTFVLAVCLIFGSVAIATSPTVTIAVINEYRAKGPLTQTVLSITVLKDLVVIVFFATALAVAKPLLDEDLAFSLDFLRTIGVEIFGSIFAGVLLGWLVSLIIRRVQRESTLFVIGLAILIAEASVRLHLEPLLVSLVTGFFLENLTARDAEPMLRGIERSSFPVYAIFFALAGAGLHLDALARLWPIALTLVAVRVGALWLGTYVGARLSGAEEVVRRYGWLGFISQAGVTLGLSVIVVRAFPDWGPGVQTIIVAMIAIHELIGPLAFHHGLARAGEVGQRPS